MKCFLLGLFISINVFASNEEVIRLNSPFSFKDVRIFIAQDVEMVDGRNQKRLKELNAENFQCMPKGGAFRCHKFVNDAVLSEDLKAELTKAWSETKLSFKQGLLEPELFNDAESIKEWNIYDKVSLNNKSTDRYQYRLSGNTTHKLVFSLDGTNHWFVIEDAKNIFTLVEKQLRTNMVRVRTMTIAVDFEGLK